MSRRRPTEFELLQAEEAEESKMLRAEVKAVVVADTLCEAYKGETLSDVVALHRSVLKTRLGGDYPKDEEFAISRLRVELCKECGLRPSTWNELPCGSEVLTDAAGTPIRVSDSRDAEDYDAIGYDIEDEIIMALADVGWDVELGDWSTAQGEPDATAPVKGAALINAEVLS